MKRVIRFISPFIIGSSAGLFVECFLRLLSNVISPFSGPELKHTLLFFGSIAFVSFVITVAAVIFDIVCLSESEDDKMIKAMVIFQFLVIIITFFASWGISDHLFAR